MTVHYPMIGPEAVHNTYMFVLCWYAIWFTTISGMYQIRFYAVFYVLLIIITKRVILLFYAINSHLSSVNSLFD